eukprot:10255529-Karenia_brevis.AAC.1
MCGIGEQNFFASERALRSHQRSKHGLRSSVKCYADADGRCKACRTTFSSRLRLIAHLSDKRRTACLRFCTAHVQPLSTAESDRLDMQDREERKAARRAGHTQPLSKARAIKCNGSYVGRIKPT